MLRGLAACRSLTLPCLAGSSSGSHSEATAGDDRQARRALSVCMMDGATHRPDGSPLGATILFGNDEIPARLGNDPETRRGMLGATAADGLWDPAVAGDGAAARL